MKKYLMSGVLAMIFIVAAASLGLAETKTNNLGVTASVAASCSITGVSAIAFGAYDPTSESNVDADGSLSFRCVKNTSYRTFIAGTRTMTGSGESLTFNLYTDSGRGSVFPADNSVGASTAANNNVVTTNIYGRIASGQDAGVANYSATLTATIEY